MPGPLSPGATVVYGNFDLRAQEAFKFLLERVHHHLGPECAALLPILFLEAAADPVGFVTKYGLDQQSTLKMVAQAEHLESPPGFLTFTSANMSFQGLGEHYKMFLTLAMNGGLAPKDTTLAGSGVRNVDAVNMSPESHQMATDLIQLDLGD